VLTSIVRENLNEPIVIVQGGARGADQIAKLEALKLGLPVETHVAAWDTLGKKAGPVRNEQMAENGADLCIAFWDGKSVGTRDMIQRAKEREIPVKVVVPA
jgi:hypothetical protein